MGRWTSNKAKGHAQIFGKDHVPTGEEDWMVCTHCYYGWKVEPGSGRRRGWCFECKGPLCGRDPKKDCRECKFILDMKFYVSIGAVSRFGTNLDEMSKVAQKIEIK